MIDIQAHVLCVCLQIENQAYPVNVDALHTVFQPYGVVQKIACFEKNNTWQVSCGALADASDSFCC